MGWIMLQFWFLVIFLILPSGFFSWFSGLGMVTEVTKYFTIKLQSKTNVSLSQYTLRPKPKTKF